MMIILWWFEIFWGKVEVPVFGGQISWSARSKCANVPNCNRILMDFDPFSPHHENSRKGSWAPRGPHQEDLLFFLCCCGPELHNSSPGSYVGSQHGSMILPQQKLLGHLHLAFLHMSSFVSPGHVENGLKMLPFNTEDHGTRSQPGHLRNQMDGFGKNAQL